MSSVAPKKVLEEKVLEEKKEKKEKKDLTHLLEEFSGLPSWGPWLCELVCLFTSFRGDGDHYQFQHMLKLYLSGYSKYEHGEAQYPFDIEIFETEIVKVAKLFLAEGNHLCWCYGYCSDTRNPPRHEPVSCPCIWKYLKV